MRDLFIDFDVDTIGKGKSGFYPEPKIGSKSIDEIVSFCFPDGLREDIANTRAIIKGIISDSSILVRFATSELDGVVVRDIVEEVAHKLGLEIKDPLSYAYTLQSENNQPGIYLDKPLSITVLDNILKYAKSHFNLRYFVQQAERAKEVIRRYFPQVYLDLDYEISYIEGGINEAEHSRLKNGKHNITIHSEKPIPYPPDSAYVYDLFEKGTRFRRRVTDLLYMVHEYTHGIFDEINPQPKKIQMKKEDYYQTADSAFNEGLSMLIEREIAERLSKSTSFGLTDEDKRNFSGYNRVRIKNPKLSYKDGLAFFSRLYTEGGIEEVYRFVRNLNRNLTHKVRRGSKEYSRLCSPP